MKTMKKFIFGLTALLGVSLFLAGCGDAEGGAAGSPGRLGDGHIGGAPSIAGLQAMIDRYNGTGAELVLDNITLAGPGIVDFKGVKAYVVGNATLSGGVLINAVSATVGFADGARISGSTSDVIIGKSTVFTSANVTGGAWVAAPVSDEADFGKVGPITAIENLTLGKADQIPAGLKVYVYGTLKVDEDSEQPSGSGSKVTAIKRVALAGTPDDATALADNDIVDVRFAEIGITASSHKVEITLDVGTTSSPSGGLFNLANAGDVLTVKGATTAFVADVLGNGKLVLADAVTGVKITGNGRVQFSHGSAIAFVAASSIDTGPNGYAQFDQGFKTPGSAATVTLSGNVLIPVDKTITFGNVGGTVTLKKGTTVSIPGDTPVPVLTAVSDLVLTPAAITSVVTVKTGGAVAVSATASNTGVTFGGSVEFGGDLTLTAAPATFNGTAFFANGKKISLSATQSVITLATGGGALAIWPTAPKVPDVYSTVLSADTANAVLTPSAALTLAFAADENTKSITQAGAVAHGITLTGTATVTSGATYVVASTSSAAGSLTVAADGVLTLGSGFLMDEEEGTPPVASLVLTGASSNAATLVLKGDSSAGGKLVVDPLQTATVTVGNGADATNFLLTNNSGDTTTKATVTKDGTNKAAGVVVKAADANATSGVLLGSIAGGTTADTNDATVTGPLTAGNDSVITKGWKVKVPNS